MVQSTFKIDDGIITGVQVEIKAYRVKKFNPKKCGYCGKEFTPNHSHNLYCSKQCRYYSDLEHANERKRRYRKRYHGQFNDRAILNVGTSDLGKHRNPDTKVEHSKIREEMRRIGIR